MRPSRQPGGRHALVEGLPDSFQHRSTGMVLRHQSRHLERRHGDVADEAVERHNLRNGHRALHDQQVTADPDSEHHHDRQRVADGIHALTDRRLVVRGKQPSLHLPVHGTQEPPTGIGQTLTLGIAVLPYADGIRSTP